MKIFINYKIRNNIGCIKVTDISVLMPCHNESRRIKHNIQVTVDAVENIKNGSFELIMIDDGSSDETLLEIKKAAESNDNVKYIRLDQNQGKGQALRKGFKIAKGKYICFLDGDLDLHPKLIKIFIEYMERENADAVIGSKRHPDSDVNYPFDRKFASVLYQVLVKTLFGLSLTDSLVGVKLFKKEVLTENFHKGLVKRFAFDVELLVNAHKSGYKIVEAPITMDIKKVENSDINMKSIIRIFVDTLAIFYRLNILHYYEDKKRKKINKND